LVIDDDDANDPLIITADPPRNEISLGPVENHYPSVPGLVPASRIPQNGAPPIRPTNSVTPLASHRPLATTIAAAALPPQEPIARAVVGGWNGFVGWFSNPRVSSVLKILVVVVGIVAALYSVRWLVPVALGLIVIYGLYYAIRSLILALRSDAQAKNSIQP
jgi:hypothetical protein